MKSFIVFALFVAAAVALPVDSEKDAQVVESYNDNIGVDGYKTGYKTSNGISATEEGKLKNVGTENEAIEARGQFAYTGTDGVQYQVTWTADEFGFHPQGAHLPVAPQA